MPKKETSNHSGVTLDDLAIMVQNGFEAMDQKFEKKFVEVHEKMDLHFDILSGRIRDSAAHNRDDIVDLDTRVTRLERKTRA